MMNNRLNTKCIIKTQLNPNYRSYSIRNDLHVCHYFQAFVVNCLHQQYLSQHERHLYPHNTDHRYKDRR